MAEIGGFEIETPQEVQARIQAQIDSLRRQNPEAANSQVVINALFGNPEMRQAEQRQDALSRALGSVTKEEGEEEEDFQIRQQQAVRSQLSQIDPGLALQANDNIIRLNAEKLERQALGVELTQSRLDLSEAQREATEAKTPVLFKSDQRTGISNPVRRLPIDSTQDEINAALAAAQAADPNAVFQIGSGLDVLELEKVAGLKESGTGLNNSTVGTRQDALLNTANFFFEANSALETLKDTPFALIPGSRTAAAISAGTSGVRAFLTEIGFGEDLTEEQLAEDERTFRARLDRDNILSQGADFGINNAVMEGMIKSLAYQLAKALDPEGRLSDQDVEMAAAMLVGTGEPAAILELFRHRIGASAFAAEGYLDAAMVGDYGEQGQSAAKRFIEQKQRIGTTLDEFEDILGRGGLLKIHGSAFGREGTGEQGARAVERGEAPGKGVTKAADTLVLGDRAARAAAERRDPTQNEATLTVDAVKEAMNQGQSALDALFKAFQSQNTGGGQ